MYIKQTIRKVNLLLHLSSSHFHLSFHRQAYSPTSFAEKECRKATMKSPSPFFKSSRMTSFSAVFWPRKTPQPTLHVESIMALPLGQFLLCGSPNQALQRTPSLPLLSLHSLLHLRTSSTPTKPALRRNRSLIS